MYTLSAALFLLLPLLVCFQEVCSARDTVGAHSWKKDVLFKLKNQDYENVAPLIGVLAQPHPPKDSKVGAHQSISGPLVQWIESAGGRVVPIRYDSSKEEVEELFETLNGLVFPGGSGTLWYGHAFFDTAAHLWSLAKDANRNGELFPVFGICLGFETIHILVANRTSEEILVPAAGQESVANTLELMDGAKDSVFFSNWKNDLILGAADPRRKPTFNAHEWAVPLSVYKDHATLDDELEILSTSTDTHGHEYVSTVEGRNMPIFATQWHPEKTPYEFSDKTIPHTRTAIDAAYASAQIFVETAKLNPEKIPYKDQVKLVIQNYEQVFIASDPEEVKSRDPLPDTVWMIPDSAGPLPSTVSDQQYQEH
ncbi:hypothetical protein M9435_004215 [Picochlorum sp. BPE23]|nr:hypothetical protein M9435_004215 [Picochlorum sp. BPE23]